MTDDNDILKHFGVPGMKWGVRKGPSVSSDHAKASNVKGKKAKHLSDEELKTAIARIRLEKDYKSLTKREISAGEKLAAKIIITTPAKVVGGALVTIGSAIAVQKLTPIVANLLSKAVIKYAEYKMGK